MLSTNSLISGSIEELFPEKKYFGAFVSNIGTKKTYLLFLQRQTKKVNSNLFAYLFYYANG